jgi:polysaccharide biosynthesis transport protein
MMHPEQESVDLELAKSHEAAEYLGMKNWSAADTQQKRGLNLNPFKRLVQRNWLLIGLPTLLAGGITGATVLLSPQTYSGMFQVLVEPMSTEGKLVQPAVLTPDASTAAAELDYLTLVRVLTSPSVLSGIIQKVQTKYNDITYADLTKKLTVERIEKNSAEKTKIVSVTYENTDPQEILFTLNELSAGYLKFGLEDRKSQIGGGVAFIEQQLPEIKRRVETLEVQMQALQQQHSISDLEGEGTALAQQARQVQTQQLDAQRDLAAQKSLYNNLQQQLGGGVTPKDIINASSLSENPRYQALLGQLKQIESQIATTSFEPDHPGLQALQDQRKSLTALLQQESQKLVGSTSVPQFQPTIQKTMNQQLVDSLNQIQVLEVRNQALGQASAAIEQKTQQFPEIKRRSNDLQAQLEIAQNTLKQLQLKRESLRVEAAQKEVPWRLLSKPDLLKDAQGNLISSSRKGLQKILLGLLGGFLLGMGLAILREKRRDIFYSLEDLQEDAKSPLLGIFPVENKLTPVLPTSHQESETWSESPSFLLKAAESLYTNLRFLPLEGGVKSLVIASASPRDGKTTVITYLAKASASSGQRVLVVDTNMSSPQLHSWLDVPNFEGLNEVLTKSVDPNQLIQRSPQQSNLFVLPSGQGSSASRKLMGSQQMQHLMGQLHTMFDLVLYDTLPLQSSADANFLSRNADGMLLVVSVGKTRRSLVLKLLKKIQGVRIPLLGIVANQVKSMPSSSESDKHDSLEHFEDEFEMFRISPSQE